MKRIAIALAAGLAIAAGGAPFEAPSAEALLSAGHKLRAAQFCHRHRGHKGEGVTLYIRSVSESGTRAQVGVAIACWGDAACTSESCDQHTLKGSLTVEGESAALEFRDSGNPQRGVLEPLRGRLELREGKPALVFGKSVMQFTGGPIETPELVFQ
jgi:hypothetical protein